MSDRYKLAILIFCFYGSMGFIFPYLPLVLSRSSVSDGQIGIVLSVGPALIVILQPFWGWLSDRVGIKRVLTLTLVGTIAATTTLFFAEGFYGWIICLFFYFLFFNPVSSLIDALALFLYGKSFGSLRLWGSVGYACSVFVGGYIISHFQVSGSILLFCSNMIMIFVSLLLVRWAPEEPKKEVEAPSTQQHNEAESSLQQRKVSVKELLFSRGNGLLFVMMLMFLLTSLAVRGFFNYYSLGLEKLGAKDFVMGTAWLLQVVPEIGIFLLADRLLRRYSPWLLVLLGTGAYLIQFLILGFVPVLWAWVVFQPLVAIGFAFWYVGAVQTIRSIVPDKFRTTGQAVFSSITYGIGGIGGGLFSGMLVDRLGIHGFFKAGALLIAISFAGMLILQLLRNKDSRTSVVHTHN